VATHISKGERTRLNIVKKAAPVFNQHGYSGTSLAQVMEQTGLEKGGIYRHFKSKQELAVAAFDYAWSETKRSRLEALKEFSSPLKRLHGMVDNFADKPSVTAGGCPLLNTAIDSDDGDEELRIHARDALREWLCMVEQTLKDGIAQGEIVKNISIPAIASVLVATLEGSVMMARLEGTRSAREYARQHLHALLHDITTGITARKH
jgi:TetR/AcrR family transcriptional repressor of nem operon